MAYGNFKDFERRTASDKILRDKAFNIAKNPKYDGYQRGLTSMVYIFFDKKPDSLTDKSVSGSGASNNGIKQNLQLTKELHKAIIRTFRKRKVYSGFKDNIWGADLADMQLISKFNKGFRFLLCAIDIFRKYDWVVLLKDEEGASIVNAFQKILNDLYRSEASRSGGRRTKDKGRKPNKIWVNQGSKIYNSSFKNG